MPVRRELGIPTAFNFLGPLVNPGRVRRQVVGVSDARAGELMINVLARNGAVHAMVVYGNDGLDELTTTTTSMIYELRDGEVSRYEIDPLDFGIERASREDLVGATPDVNASRVRSILEGESHPQADLVALNAAAGLIVGGTAETFPIAVARAREILASGKSVVVLERLVELSNA